MLNKREKMMQNKLMLERINIVLNKRVNANLRDLLFRARIILIQ